MERFISIQGEGRFSGCPTYFIRCAGCNFSCDYCDTPAARDESCARDVSVEEILGDSRLKTCGDVCITGGEPMLQEAALTELLSRIPDNHRVSLETNGSLSLGGLRSRFPSLYLSVDWKTPCSGETQFNRDNLRFIAHRGWLKFVVRDECDFDFIRAAFPTLSEFEDDVFVSPVSGSDLSQLRRVADFIVTNRTRFRGRMQMQLHRIVGVP